MAFERKDGKKVSSRNHDRADDLLGAVVPSRERDDPAASLPPEADLSNVIPFAPRNRKGAETSAPALEIAIADRPAPFLLSPECQRQIALLIGGSLFIHGAIFAAFNREPEPHASIGVISVTVEIVLGAQTNAGKSKTPSESEVASAPWPETDKPVGMESEKARKNLTQQPVEEPKEDARQEKPETATPRAGEAPQIEKPPLPTEQAERPVQTKPVEKPKLTGQENKPDAKETRKVREAARHAKDDGERKRDHAAPASTPSTASNSIGRGRSDLDTNYRGIVAAHLARYKQFPADARSRGDQGTATVSFSLSGSGSVTSVRLVRGSGVSSIDQETTAMVRRASPFPAPPSGRGMSFTVPVRFHLR